MDMDFNQEDFGLIADTGEERSIGPYARVRFLHAASGYGPVNVAVDDLSVNQLEFGTMSSFASVPDGFAMVTVSSSRMPRIAMLRRNLLFPAGTVLTAAIMNSPEGLDLRLIPEL